MLPHIRGSSIVNAVAPQARATMAKSIGCNSHPYSGFPRKPNCSHLICPRVLFLTTNTLIGSLYLTAVAISAISIEKPPSPMNAMHCRLGYAIWAAIVYGKAHVIVARLPEHEYICPRCALMCRAHHVVIVPESDDTTASGASRLPS